MSKIDSTKGFKKGYEVNKIMSDNQLNKKFSKATKKQDKAKSYPNGMIPFGCLLLFYLIFLIVSLSVMAAKDHVLIKNFWHTSVLSCGMAYLLMNVLWAIGRTGFLSNAGYSLMKFGRFVRFNELRQKIDRFIENPAVEDVETPYEYKEFIGERKKYTKKWFIISLSTSGAIAAISLIIYFIAQYTIR